MYEHIGKADHGLTEVADQLHTVVQSMQEGSTQNLSLTTLAQLVSDTANLYANASLAAGRELDIASSGLTATTSVMLISALMRAENLNTFDLALWLTQIGDRPSTHQEER
ncbi:hypothetical protein EGJ27_02645 [Pseudomonas sp. v388]|nr:hypothetical protein EGJ27_02645 [Pseudomonas sp. v388]